MSDPSSDAGGELPPLDELLSKADGDKLKESFLDLLAATDLRTLSIEQMRALLNIFKNALERQDAPPKPGESLGDRIKERQAAGTADAAKAWTEYIGVISRVTSQLTKDQVETLLGQLRRGNMWGTEVGRMSGEFIADLIAPTSPEVAQQIRAEKNPETIAIYIGILIAFLDLLLNTVGLLNDPPPPSTHVEIHIESNVTNLPAPPYDRGQG